jgi:RNA polymerase sigma-70 factor (ECF subfamily)
MFPFFLAITSVQNINNPHDNFEKEASPLLDEFYNLALRLTGRQKTAYKLLLESHKKGYHFYNHLDSSIDFKSWMFRVLKNTYNDTYNKKIDADKTGYGAITDFIEKLRTSVDFSNLKEKINKLTPDEITEEVSSLPDEYKLAIVMHDIEGFTYEETAGFVDVPSGTLRSRLHRGRKMLFAKLYNHAADRVYVEKITMNTGKEEVNESRDLYFIAALSDGEISDAIEEEKLRKEIEKNTALKFEFDVQSFVKILISEKLKTSIVSLNFKKKLLRKIKSKGN